MDFHIDRRVVLSQDSEFESLYKWSLQELDGEGNKIGRDQIPWNWSLNFILTELRLIDEIEVDPDYNSDDDGNIATREKQSIGARLRPGYPWEHRQYFEPSYSMFGTGRTIYDFALQIMPLEGEQQQEQCTAWGCVSYSAEIDFRNETTDDTVTFYLYVSPETFARYAQKIAASEVDKAFFRVGGVSGFYSDWSPSISTSDIKVLTSDKEHAVEIPDECEITPPRLGKVREAALFLYSINSLESTKAETAGQNGEWFRLGRGSADIDAAVKNYLDENLLKPTENEENSWSFHSQFNEIAGQVAQSVTRYCKDHGEDSSQCVDKLSDAFDILTSIRYATNEKTHHNSFSDEESEEKKVEREKTDHTIWYHGNALFAFQEGFESKYSRKVEIDYLQEEARKYLLRPWMENERLEWIIVDALTFSAVTGFGEEIKQHALGPVSILGLNMAYFSAKGNIKKMIWKRIQYGLTKFGIKLAVFIGAPVAIGWYFWSVGYQDKVSIAGAIYIGLMVLYLSYRFLRWIFGKKQRPELGKYEEFLDTLNHMMAAYDMLGGAVVSPTAFRQRLLDTARKGAAWPGAIFSILDHAIQRNPAIWGAEERDRYRY